MHVFPASACGYGRYRLTTMLMDSRLKESSINVTCSGLTVEMPLLFSSRTFRLISSFTVNEAHCVPANSKKNPHTRKTLSLLSLSLTLERQMTSLIIFFPRAYSTSNACVRGTVAKKIDNIKSTLQHRSLKNSSKDTQFEPLNIIYIA